ncbi:MAG: cytochrome P450 [Chloroflexota bacterium]
MTNTYRLTFNELGEFRRDQRNMILQLTERLGRVAHINILGIKMHLVSDPDVIRELLVRNSHQLHRDSFTTNVLGRMLGQGLFIAEDQAWQRQRKLVQPIFHAVHIQDFVQIFAQQARDMCKGWVAGQTYPLDQEMMALTLRIICQTMFSADIEGETERLGTLMRIMLTEAEAQLKSGLPLPAWLPTPGNLRQKRAIRGIHELLRSIIRERHERIELGEEVESDLLTMLLMARDEDGEPMSQRQVLDECMTVFFAGHETTAVALTWAWSVLLQEPDVLNRLREEIINTIGDQTITYEHIAQMPYLSQVLKETLRLYPPAPGFGRTPTEPFQVNGHQFNPGDTIIVSINTLHYQNEFYPDPEHFDPERFAPEQEQPDRYMYMPFGAGSRICIGNAFAMLEMQVVLATMIQMAAMKLENNQEIVPETLVTLRPKNGVKIQVVEKRSISLK